MRYLLDTHTLIWFIEGDLSLPSKVKKEITNVSNDCYLSIASLWEIAIKLNIGKLEFSFSFDNIEDFLSANKIQILPITFLHLQRLTNLNLIHRDPFDRLIISQAIAENLTILTKDNNIQQYPVKYLW
jgi:PIN domain nuclease of toxin-antitoxin system